MDCGYVGWQCLFGRADEGNVQDSCLEICLEGEQA